MKQIPPIKAVMTPFPHSIDIDAGLDDARKLMAEHRIRHLPVVEEGELCGMLSQRDMDRAEKMGPTRVREVCSRRTYCVDMSTPVTHVLKRMAEDHVGSAMVTRQGKTGRHLHHHRCLPGLRGDAGDLVPAAGRRGRGLSRPAGFERISHPWPT